MQIVWNENIKDALRMTCEYASTFDVDITVHIYADGDAEVTVTPTYRDRPIQTDCAWK